MSATPAVDIRMSETPVRQDFLVFGAPLIGEEEIEDVVACLRGGWIGSGPRVAAFEKAFAEYRAGSKHAAAVSSCTAALHLSLLAAGLRPGDEVITTPMTFCATVNAIIHAGLKPVLADVDPVTQNIDPNEVEARITSKTRAILPVHFAGRPCDMSALVDIASRHDLKIIEDCAHAAEAHYQGQPLGTFGDFGCFSFYVTKNMTTGEGGMVLARTEEARARVRTLALHGLSQDAWRRYSDTGYKHYEVVDCGFKYNMTDMQAALGIHQLRRIEPNWQRREVLWNRYLQAFDDLPLGLPAPVAPGSRHSYHLFTLQIDAARCGLRRDEFVDAMTRLNIGVGVHYVGIPDHPYYQRGFGWSPADYPHAARISRETVSIPLSAKLTDRDAADVIAAVARVLHQDRRSNAATG
jgi:dTDP-4-amino-4,6-dideoxygalactose transaminase